MNSLKERLAEKRKKSCSKLVEIAGAIKSALAEHKFKELLFLVTEFRETGTKLEFVSDEAKFLMKSNLFFMGEDISSETLTYGADPEFILCDVKDEDKIVLFSSKYRVPYTDSGEYSMSSLSIGADYGLLELRPTYSISSYEDIVGRIADLITTFDNERDSEIKVKEAEAAPFLHKIERMREIMDGVTNGEDELDYGGNRMKMGGVTATSVDDIAVAGAEYYGISLTAYDTPSFAVGTDKVLTAGGHLHFGGACIKVLSMGQLKALVRKLDEKLLPIAKKVETKMAKLRRQYYGFPGEFRLKSYGFEYRVLSCAPFWKKNLGVLTEILKEANRIITKFDF